MSQPRSFTAITNLRKTSAEVVNLCDLIIYGTEREANIGLRRLIIRMRLLSSRLQRAQTALEREGIS